MKYFRTKLIILVLLSAFLNSCTETSTININGEKHAHSLELDYGVSIVPPEGFKKAKSYIGIQAPNQGGSIELVMETDFEKLKNAYSKESIKSKKGKLYRHQPVIYSDNENAFYVEFYDTTQKRYRQVLVISIEERVYHIKSFHRGKPNHSLSNVMRMALMTTHIGEYYEKGQPFSKTFIADLNKFRYTRDNKFPTQSPDSLVVTVEYLANSEIKNNNTKVFLKNRVNSICEGCLNILRDELENGYILKCPARSSSKSVLGILVVSDQGRNTLIECVGNEKTDLKEIGNLMISKFLYVR